MKSKVLTLAVLLFCAVSVMAQSPPPRNCIFIQATFNGLQRVYGPGNVYIASQTVTYVVQCFNGNTARLGPAANPLNSVTGTGEGGYDTQGRVFNCSPTFYTAPHNQTYYQPGLLDVFVNGANNYKFYPSGGNSSGNGPCPNNTFCWPHGYCWFDHSTENESYCWTTKCTNPACPIIIDVYHTGYQLTNYEDGVTFDMSGTPQKMSWTAKGSMMAFLTLPGPDGLVHNGSQLFGNYTPQPPTASPNGFNALAVYDTPERGGNGDGVIDSRDAVWPKLRLWVDLNHDGISQPDEMFAPETLGVNSISLHYAQDSYVDANGNAFRYVAQMNPDHPDRVNPVAFDVFFVTCPPPVEPPKQTK